MQRLAVYGLLGFANTTVDVLVYLALTRMLDIEPMAANASGFMAGAVHSYIANGKLTFRDRMVPLLSAGSAIRFAGVTATCLSVSSATIAAFLTVLPDLAAKAIAMVVTLVVGYWLNRTIVYVGRANSKSHRSCGADSAVVEQTYQAYSALIRLRRRFI
jgi:putative flippase GtrA